MEKKILEGLESNDPEDRINAIAFLGRSDDAAYVDPLIDHLERESDRSLRERIILALGDFLPRVGFRSVERMLRSHDAFIRNAGVDILRKQDKGVLPKLAELSRDKDKDVRKLAIDAAEAYRDRQVVAILKERFSDSDINVVCTAVEYLGKMEAKEAVSEIDLLLLTSENSLLSCTALEALASIGHSEHIEEIKEKFLKNKDPLLRYSFIKFMGRCASIEIFAEYIENLISSDGAVYARETIDSVEMFLKRFPEVSSHEGIKNSLMKLFDLVPVGEVRYELSYLLSIFSSDDMLKTARKDIQASDIMSLLAAIEILGKFGVEDDLESLESVCERVNDENVEEAANDAIGRIAKRISGVD